MATNFIQVDPEEVPVSQFGRRGNVSAPILTDFLDSNMVLAKLPDDAVGENAKSVYSSLSSYARNHEMPIKVIQRKTEIYLRRLDLNDAGEPVAWEPPAKDDEVASENGAEAEANEYESV